MLIQQFNQELGQWNIMGTGRVLCKQGQTPINESNFKTYKKIFFNVLAGAKLIEGKWIYQTLSCCVMGNQYNKQLYEIAKNLKRLDIINFSGHLIEYEYMDQATGILKKSKECSLEWLLPIKLINADTVNLNINNNEYLF